MAGKPVSQNTDTPNHIFVICAASRFFILSLSIENFKSAYYV